MGTSPTGRQLRHCCMGAAHAREHGFEPDEFAVPAALQH